MKPHATPDTLHEEVLRRIASAGGIRHYPAHAVLINEGERSDTLFILLSGRVKVYASDDDGNEVTVNIHGAGEYVGEMALDGEVRSASVMTLEPCTCSIISGSDLRDFITRYPDFALHLIHRLIRRARQATESLKDMVFLDVYGRTVKLLLELAPPNGERRVIAERLSQRDIAERVGASREMVNRVFKQLLAGGYVEVAGGHITILKKPPPAW